MTGANLHLSFFLFSFFFSFYVHWLNFSATRIKTKLRSLKISSAKLINCYSGHMEVPQESRFRDNHEELSRPENRGIQLHRVW
jgi:hypothetical protein